LRSDARQSYDETEAWRKLEAERLHEMMKLTKNQAKQIRTLKRMKDADIDFTDIPEKTDWSNAAVGKFYRPPQFFVDY
jgi:hypothetical protein